MFRNVLSLPPLSWEPRKQSVFDKPCHVTCRLILNDIVLLEFEFILVTLECNACLAYAQNSSKYSQTSKGRHFDVEPRSGPSNFPLRIERHDGVIIMFEMLPVNEDLRRPEKKNRASTGITFSRPKLCAVAPSLDHP